MSSAAGQEHQAEHDSTSSQRRTSARSPLPTTGGLVDLQRLAGNAAVRGLIRRRPTVQRRADVVGSRLLSQAERKIAAAQESRPTESDTNREPPSEAEIAVEKARQRRSLAVDTPDSSQGRNAAKSTATEVKAEADAPPKPVAEEHAQAAPPAVSDDAEGPASKATQAAQAAFAAVDAEVVPDTPPPADIPEPVQPVDGGGGALPADPVAEAQASVLTQRLQALRAGAHALRVQAGQERAQAQRTRGLIETAQGRVTESESSVVMLRSHTAHRRQVVGQSRSALQVSQQKAAAVTSGAPRVAAKADEGRAESKPIANETSSMAGENASKQPEDSEAAGKSAEQGGKLTKVSSDATRIDTTIGQTKERAGQLAVDAQRAQTANAASTGKIAATEGALARTDARSAELAGQNQAARARLAGLQDGPASQLAGAAVLDGDAQRLDQSAGVLGARVHSAQQKYANDMSAVPPPIPQPTLPIQRVCCEARERFDPGGAVAGALPWWLTGESAPSAQKRVQAVAAAEDRRRAELAEIEREAGDNFANLSGWRKAGIALRLTGRNLLRQVGETSLPKFFGHLVLGFVHPGVSLMGIVRGFGLIASGGANLLSAAQWRPDPIGNALKSLADIASGVAIVLGSVAMLATAISIILTAIAIVGSIFSFGAIGLTLAPIITFCGSVATATVPLALKAAVVALALHGMVFIKDLIDAASADTAIRVQSESEQMAEDATNAGNMAMMIGMIKASQAGGRWVAGRSGAGESAPPAEAGGRAETTPTEAGPPAESARPAEAASPAEAAPPAEGQAPQSGQGSGSGGGRPSQPPASSGDPADITFTAEGPMVRVPVTPSGAPTRVGEAGAGPRATNLGLPPQPGQGDPAVVDPSLVEVTRSDIPPNTRPGVQEWDATGPPPPAMRGLDTLIINNPRGYNVDIATVGEAVRPGGRIIIQGRAEVTPGMRGVNPNMTRILRQVQGREGDQVVPGYRVVEVITDPTARSGDPATTPRPPDTMGGPFSRTDGSAPVSWPNTRITIEKLPPGAESPASPEGGGPAQGPGRGPSEGPGPGEGPAPGGGPSAAAPINCPICGAPQ